MKNGMKYTVCIAAAAMAFGGCVKSDEQSAIPSSAGKVAVSFAAQSEHIGSDSRAAIDEGYENGTFSGAWEATDRISVEATLDGTGEHLNFSYDPESRLFKGEMTEGVGRRTYRAVYPATDGFNSIPFGRERVQKGKSFNSAYDAMMVAAYHRRECRSGQDRHRRRNRIRIAAPDGYRRCGIHLLRCDGGR